MIVVLKKPLLVSVNDMLLLLICIMIFTMSLPVISFYQGKMSLIYMVIFEVLIIISILPTLTYIKNINKG